MKIKFTFEFEEDTGYKECSRYEIDESLSKKSDEICKLFRELFEIEGNIKGSFKYK